MKPRWHLLFLLLSLATALLVAYLLSNPIYEINDVRHISFNQCNPERKEWSVIVGSQDMKNWWLETRAGRSPDVVRKLAIELPILETGMPYEGTNFQYASDFIVCSKSNGLYHTETRVVVEHLKYLLHVGTGKLLRRLTYLQSADGMIALHGSKYAYVENSRLTLMDNNRNKSHVLNMPGADHLQFSPDGKLLAAIQQNELALINGESAKVLSLLRDQKKIVTFRFISNDTLLITFNSNDEYFEHSRWRWNGTNLLQISPGVRQEQCFINPKIKIFPIGEIHLCTNPEFRWPPPLHPFLNWLTEKGVTVERWLSRKNYDRWILIDESNQVQQVYFELHTSRRPLFDSLSAEVSQGATSATIRLWNEHPFWPNALAAGVLLYLFLYVLKRCLATSQNKFALNP